MSRVRWELLVDGRFRVEQQRHDVGYLRLGQDTHVARTRHIGAGVVSLAVPDFAPRVLNNGLRSRTGRIGHTAQLAVVVQTWAYRSKRDFFLVDLVAVVAIASVRRRSVIGPGEATATLRNFFALFPVTQNLPFSATSLF